MRNYSRFRHFAVGCWISRVVLRTESGRVGQLWKERCHAGQITVSPSQAPPNSRVISSFMFARLLHPKSPLRARMRDARRVIVQSERENGHGPTGSLAASVMAVIGGLGIIQAGGCGSSALQYSPNELYAAGLLREEGSVEPDAVAEKAAEVVSQWFGTLDAPRWPKDVASVVDMESVLRSAGPVGRGNDKIERGLYRKHCVSCHGLTGDGHGPAAMVLAPYPRDFRRGTFKFKSTPHGSKPTREDLQHTLRSGLPGTAMPSFAALEQADEFAHDVEALVEYVRFLSIRGEVERKLITKHVREGVELVADAPECVEAMQQVVASWESAPARAVAIPEPPVLGESEMADSIARGRKLYLSELTACAKCHGPEGRGDGNSQDFDDWTKDWTLLAGIDPKDPRAWRAMKPFGALKPVFDRPRNFASGGFRGGSKPTDLFRRLVLGIEGSPMPPIARAEGNNPGLTDDEIWDLVHYVMSLGEVKP